MSAAQTLGFEGLPAGITLHEYGRTRGFLARAYSDGNCSARKLFSWGAHGGVDAALAAALAWLEAQEPQGPRPRKRSAGYGYVRRTLRSYRDGQGELVRYPAFEVWVWGLDGRPRQTSYGIDAYGEAEAEALCHRWLERQRRAIERDGGNAGASE